MLSIADLQAYVSALPEADVLELEDQGLLLYPSPVPGAYECSPPGYFAFATTGGDGVHFSMPPGSVGPVVMTVPMAFDRPNHVVGDTLGEFLSLGCTSGFFALEQLAYDFEGTVARIESRSSESEVLLRMAVHFNLKPWPHVGDRLRELSRRGA